jgi:hypothetical protein
MGHYSIIKTTAQQHDLVEAAVAGASKVTPGGACNPHCAGQDENEATKHGHNACFSEE